MLKVFEEVAVGNEKFAILLDEESMTAHEAVWDGQRWNTEFSYPSLSISSLDVAESLDFDAARKLGYTFAE